MKPLVKGAKDGTDGSPAENEITGNRTAAVFLTITSWFLTPEFGQEYRSQMTSAFVEWQGSITRKRKDRSLKEEEESKKTVGAMVPTCIYSKLQL